MYNAEQKQKFIAEFTDKPSVASMCERLFNAFEDFENERGADICTQSAEVLQPMYDKWTGTRSIGSLARIRILRAYAEWCIKNNIPDAGDGLLHIKTDVSENMRRRMIKNPRHLQVYLDAVCTPENLETTDNTIRCYYWLAYGGMAEEDIFKVTAHDVILSEMRVKFEGREYPIYTEAIPAFKNCIKLTRFRYIHPNYSPDKIVYRDRVEGDILIRGVRAVPTVRSMRTLLTKLSQRALDNNDSNSVAQMQLSYYRAWLSGLFYSVYTMELAGEKNVLNVFKIEADKLTQGKIYHMESGRNTQDAKRRALAKEFMTDYETWKSILTI